jgi:hypothetical protein
MTNSLQMSLKSSLSSQQAARLAAASKEKRREDHSKNARQEKVTK